MTRTAAAGLRRWLLLAWVTAAGVAGVALPAGAHAYLVDAQPADRAVLEEAPREVRLTFNEPVQLPTGGLRVLDDTGSRVDLGVVADDDDATIVVTLPDTLPDGGYFVAWRVVSADSHPVSGVRTFTVGAAEEVGDEVIAAAVDSRPAAIALRIGQGLRALAYAATLLAAGAALMAWRVTTTTTHRHLARRLTGRAATLGLAVALLALPVQVVAVLGELGALASTTAWQEVLGSSFGRASLVRTAGLATVLMSLVVARGAAWPLPAATGAGGVALASWVLDGHQRSVEPAWLLVGGDLLHLAAAAVWLGGLGVVAALVWRRRGPGDDPGALAALVARFSTLAVVGVVGVTIGGIAMSVPLLGEPGALLSSAHGRLLLAKLGAVAVVLLVAAYNRLRLVPAVTRDHPAGWRQLTVTLRVEAGLLALVLALTGVLATTAPAASQPAAGAFHRTTAELDEDLALDVWLDTNIAGRTTLHLFVIDPPPAPAEAIEDLRLELRYPAADLGPLEVEPFGAGNHWMASLEEMTFPGEWELEIIAGIDRFTEARTTVTLPLPEG